MTFLTSQTRLYSPICFYRLLHIYFLTIIFGKLVTVYLSSFLDGKGHIGRGCICIVQHNIHKTQCSFQHSRQSTEISYLFYAFMIGPLN